MIESITKGMKVVDLTDKSLQFLRAWYYMPKKARTAIVEEYKALEGNLRSTHKLRKSMDDYVEKYITQIEGAINARDIIANLNK